MAGLLRHVLVVLAVVLYSNTVVAARTIIVPPAALQKTYTAGTAGFAFSDSGNWGATVSTQGGAQVKVPVTLKRSFGFPAWRSGAKALLKVNPAKALATAGLGGVLAGVEWIMSEGSLAKKGPVTTCYSAGVSGGAGVPCSYPAPKAACLALFQKTNTTIGSDGGAQQAPGWTSGPCWYYDPSGWYRELGTWGRTDQQSPPIPLAQQDIDSVIDGISDPGVAAQSAPSILDDVPGSFDYPDQTDFTGPSSVAGPSTTSTTTDATTGDVTTSTTQPTYSFDFSTNPLAVSTTTTTTTKNYTNGQPSSTTTTTTAPDPSNVTTNPVINPVGTGGGAPPPEVPTDCAFMPTVCEFIEWVKTPFTPEEVDFSEFTEDKDLSKSVTISGNASCPAPLVMSTSKGTFEFSWEPACTFAEMLKPLFLIAALIGAMYITLGIGRSD